MSFSYLFELVFCFSIYRSHQIAQALQMQMEVQKKLHEQLEVYVIYVRMYLFLSIIVMSN